ncbi:MAG: hydrogen gas-evolving membrane-bound hydrogenase subunit E, partial [Ilumatobacteraceae bacterium]
WPGINTAFVISLAVVASGAVVGWRVPTEPWVNPVKVSGEQAYQYLLDGLLTMSRRVTAVSQTGSLLAYLAVVMGVVGVVLGVSVLRNPGSGLDELVFADSLVQAVVAAIAIAFAFAVLFCQQRFVAALLIGGVGFSCAVLFAVFGSPDLALTQILVETLTIVVFLLVLRQMPRRFDDTSSWAPRRVRAAISVGVGVTVALFAVMVSAARTAPSAGDVYLEKSLPEGGGKNVVNVILVDFRGFDTLGEITVLAVAALGVTNLVRAARRSRRADAAAPEGTS